MIPSLFFAQIGTRAMIEHRRAWAILYIAVLIVGLHAAVVWADQPDTPTPTGIWTPTPLPPEETKPPITRTAVFTPTATAASPTPTIVSPRVEITLTPTLTATPAALVTPTPTLAAPAGKPRAASTAYIAVLVGESAAAVGGEGESEVFVSLADVEGVTRVELVLRYDPQVVRFVGQREGAGEPSLQVDVTTVDDEAGQIVLEGTWEGAWGSDEAAQWHKVAVVRWVGEQEGKSVIAIDRATRILTADGEALTLDAIYDGVMFVRPPGTIQGRVQLQGRSEHGRVLVAGALSAQRRDEERTDAAGRFAIATTHGEGFYTLTASMPGYLTAESERPVKVTLDTVVDAGAITLLGGDVNGDQAIDIRDISYVAYHFEQEDAQADVNGDGQVDILDLSLVAGNFGQVGPTVWTVPGPGEP
jgi:hypothetical protein